MTIGRGSLASASRIGRRSFGCLSALFVMKTYGFSKTVSIRCGSRTMYWESQPFSTTTPSTKPHADARLVGLLDRHDALGADMAERLGDDAADDLVLLGGDRGDVHELVAVDRARDPLQLGDNRRRPLLDAASQQHRVGALVERLHPLTNDRLREQRRRRRPVACQIGGLVGDLANELRAHVPVLVGELDLARDGHAVVGDRRRPGEPLEYDVAALGTERHLDGVGQCVDAVLQQSTRLVIEVQALAHWSGCPPRPGRECRGPAAAHCPDRPSRH